MIDKSALIDLLVLAAVVFFFSWLYSAVKEDVDQFRVECAKLGGVTVHDGRQKQCLTKPKAL